MLTNLRIGRIGIAAATLALVAWSSAAFADQEGAGPAAGSEAATESAPTAEPAAPEQAQDATPVDLGSGPLAGPRWGRPPLTGDWFGGRRWLAEHGLTFGIDIVNIVQGIADGGIDGDIENNGSIYLEMHFDTQKAGFWPGGFVDFRVEKSYGDTINTKTGTLLGANMTGLFPELDDKTVMVTKLMVTQFLTEWMGVTLGRFDSADGDANHFSGGRGRTQFFNPRISFMPQAAATTPYVLNGAGLLLLTPSLADGVPGVVSVMFADPQVAPDESGFDDDFFDEFWVGAEAHLPTRFFGLPGSQNAGFTFNSTERLTIGSIREIIAPGQEPETDDVWTLSYNFHQYLHVRDGQKAASEGYAANTPQLEGIGVFGRFGYVDNEIGLNDFYVSLGLGGRGLGAWRRDDTWGLAGFVTAGGNPGNFPLANPNDETWGVEAYYNFEILPYLHVSPDLQFLGPLADVDTAVVIGLRVKTDI